MWERKKKNVLPLSLTITRKAKLWSIVSLMTKEERQLILATTQKDILAKLICQCPLSGCYVIGTNYPLIHAYSSVSPLHQSSYAFSLPFKPCPPII